MPASRKPSDPAEITPAQRRDEIISIVAVGLVRLIRTGETPREKLSESAETGLELSRETRLSVPAG